MQDISQILHPLQLGHGSSPCDHDVSPSKTLHLFLIRGHCNVAHPIGVSAPRIRRMRASEDLGHVNVRHGIQILGHLVARVVQPHLGQHLMSVVSTAAAELGVGIEVEGVVGGLGEFTILDDLSSEISIEGIEKTLPIVGTLILSPFLPQHLLG
eukprot:Gb_26031 [translate_table: standard]